MNTNRLEAFSDGVFAIAITLLVLEIKVPPPDVALGAGLLRLWPSYFAYIVSFLVIGAIWINHHAMFRRIVRVDETLLLLNVLHLMLTAFLPFPTAVLAQAFHHKSGEAIASAFYGGTVSVNGLFVAAIWFYAARRHRLLGDHVTPQEAKQMGGRFLVVLLIYPIATIIALVAPRLALLFYVCPVLFYLWAGSGRNHENVPAHIENSEP